MKCPKCQFNNAENATECWKCGVGSSVHIRDGRGTGSSDPKMSTDALQCAWNDHGYRCPAAGSMSDSTNGSGPWYCSEHYWHGQGLSEA